MTINKGVSSQTIPEAIEYYAAATEHASKWYKVSITRAINFP